MKKREGSGLYVPDDRFSILLPDVDSLVNKIVAAGMDPAQATLIESRVDDLVDWAPNVMSFCSDRRFLGATPFAKQLEVLILLFEEFCYRCTDMDYLRDIPVKDTVDDVAAKVAMLDFGKCPHCGATKGMGRKKKKYVDMTEFIGVFGQRSGKTVLAAFIVAYLYHRFLNVQCPWRTYKQAPGQVLDFVMVSLTKTQATATTWSAFKGMVESSHWFKTYKELSDEESFKETGKEAISIRETFIFFNHKKLLASVASNIADALRGYTRIGGLIDEMSRLSAEEGSTKVRGNAPELYASIDNSCSTLRIASMASVASNPDSTLPSPLMLAISSPLAQNDAIMTHYRARGADKRVLRRHWATWDCHPTNTYESFVESGATTKAFFERDFGARPPLTDSPAFPKVQPILNAFSSPLVSKQYGALVRLSVAAPQVEMDVPTGKKMAYYVSAEMDTSLPQPPYKKLVNLPTERPRRFRRLGAHQKVFEDLVANPARSRPHVLAVDLGYTTNAVGLVAGFLANDGHTFVTDFIAEIKPTDMRPVNIASVYDDVIIPLISELNVVGVFYDRWQSLHHMQDLARQFGAVGPLQEKDKKSWLRKLAKDSQLPPFLVEPYSLRITDVTMLRSRLEQGDVLFPALDFSFNEMTDDINVDRSEYPVTHLAVQMATVRAKGIRLYKPNDGDDDLFRAWALAATVAFSHETMNQMLIDSDHKEDDTSDRPQSALMVYSKKSSYQFDASFSRASSNEGRSRVVIAKGGKRWI